jgi:hypothetical protein
MADSVWFQWAAPDHRRVELTAPAARAIEANVIPADHREEFLRDYKQFVARRA